MRLSIFILFIRLVTTSFRTFPDYPYATAFINPTGTYILDSKLDTVKGDVFGYYGEIRVKLLDHDHIAFALEVNKGAPSYNSGMASDTMLYRSDRAVYKDSYDKSCHISFSFFPDRVVVEEESADYNSGCSFGHAVIASGNYLKVSGGIPDVSDPY